MIKDLKIILVDDNESFRKALRTLLIEQYSVQIIGEAANAEDFWKIKNFHNVNVILMDLMIPKINGLELSRKILWQYRDIKIIAITMHVDKVYLISLIEAGFVGCIFKNDLVKSLILAIDIVIKGGRYFPGNILIEDNNIAK